MHAIHIIIWHALFARLFVKSIEFYLDKFNVVPTHAQGFTSVVTKFREEPFDYKFLGIIVPEWDPEIIEMWSRVHDAMLCVCCFVDDHNLLIVVG